MGLLLMILSIAGLYLALHAQFLAAVQLIVYAGAIVVLFIFVIMLINVPEDRLPVEKPTVLKLLGVVAAGLLLIEGAIVSRRFSAPLETVKQVGSVESVGRALFTDYLLAFEVTSVLLLAAVVGAVVLAKKKI
jgi:NADH-quinone oxidoreductase subunit J